MEGQHFVLTPLGGGREIGGNAWHIEWDDLSCLIDCGSHPKRPAWLGLPALQRIGRLDFVVLTHAHSDHSAALPLLLRKHPVPVLMTSGTRKLLRPMLQDALKLQRRLFEIDHNGRARLPELGPPLFDSADVERVFELAEPLERGYSRSGLTITPFSSGHIVGGVGLVLEKNGKRVILTSDIADTPKETSPGLFFPEGQFDLVISEGTRGLDCGSQDLPERADEEEKAIRVLSRVLEQKGSVLFPAFVIERAQAVARLVMRAREKKRIPAQVPLYMAGLADSMTALHAEELGLRFDWKPIPSRDWFDNLLAREQAIIVAGSGMLNAGSGAARLAEQLVSDRVRQHGIIFTGHLPPFSPGKLLLQRQPNPLSGETHACINGRIVKVLSNEIHQVHLSCHASGDRLVELIQSTQAGTVILVHGDHQALVKLASALRLAGLADVRIPANGESISFDEQGASTLTPPPSLEDERDPDHVLKADPWNCRMLKQKALATPETAAGINAQTRLEAIVQLLLTRALKDGNLPEARNLLSDYGSFLDREDVDEYQARVDEIAAWCPQNNQALGETSSRGR